MAIKNSIDFSYAINKITSKVEPEIIEQGAILESEKFNKTFKEIEESLNTLYEKTRYLEDAIAYSRVFLDTKIREFNEEMQSTMRELDSLLDMSKNLSYISYNVPIKDSHIDDKENIQPLIIKDKALMLGYKQDTSIEYSSMVRQCESIPYDENLSTVKTDKYYKAIYLEEKLAQNGLTETIVIYFDQPITLNVIDFKLSNCKVYNIRFGLINGIEEYAGDYKVGMKNTRRTCIYIKFDLVCSNYNTIIYEVLKSKITDNLWNDLKEFELSKNADLKNKTKLNTEYILSRTIQNKLTGKSTTENFTHSTNEQTKNFRMYSYIFGFDSIELKLVENETEGYFVSDYIQVGQMNSADYISLYTSEVKDENVSIEYAILDGEIECPIIPMNKEIVENELIQPPETKFLRRPNGEEIIKKDGQFAGISYADALNMTDGKYTITYTPNVSYHGYTPMNKEIRIKVYIRSYGSNINQSSYIDLITLRKYGEESLWINNY